MTLTCRHVILFLSLQIRRHHLEFNEHLHSCFGDQRFVQAHSTRISAPLIRHTFENPVSLSRLQVKGELGYYVAFRYSTCKEVPRSCDLYIQRSKNDAQNLPCSFLWDLPRRS